MLVTLFSSSKGKGKTEKKQLKYLETKLYIQIYMQILIRCSYDIYKWCKYIYTNLKNEWTKEKYLHSLTCIIYRNMHTCMYLHTHMHTHTRMHIHTHAHTHACLMHPTNHTYTNVNLSAKTGQMPTLAVLNCIGTSHKPLFVLNILKKLHAAKKYVEPIQP